MPNYSDEEHMMEAITLAEAAITCAEVGMTFDDMEVVIKSALDEWYKGEH